MTQDEARHAKKMEQIMASIDEKLERIAKSLEKMEPTVYKIPKFDIPLNDPDINEPADKYLRTITADESANTKDPAGVDNPAGVENPAASKVSRPMWVRDAGTTYLFWSNHEEERDSASKTGPIYARECLSDTFKP